MTQPAAPEFRVVVDGRQCVTAAVRDRLIELTVTDEAGEQSDTAELRLDDRDGRIKLPRKGVDMETSLGWRGGADEDRPLHGRRDRAGEAGRHAGGEGQGHRHALESQGSQNRFLG